MRMLLVLLLSGCAYTADTVKNASDADLCNGFFYRGAPNYMSRVVYEELKTRDSPCLKYGSVTESNNGALMVIPTK